MLFNVICDKHRFEHIYIKNSAFYMHYNGRTQYESCINTYDTYNKYILWIISLYIYIIFDKITKTILSQSCITKKILWNWDVILSIK